MSQELLTANHASALAATLAGRANRGARGFGAGVYPITPQTECIELLCKQDIEKGHVVRVESEHSAMAVCMGFAIGGSRTFTASSSNGLAYMAENVFAAGFYRLPIVMMAVNRTLGPPWNIWVDHGDTLMLRDSGWLQFYCEDNQEVADTILAAYRLGEDPRVCMPVMVCQDAFVLSHTITLTDMPEQELVDKFLPQLDLKHRISDKPRTVGGLDGAHESELHRWQQETAMRGAERVYAEVQTAFQEVFGRPLADAVVPYCMDDAEFVIVSMGTTHSTVRHVVDAARDRGIKVGALRVRLFRPLPVEGIERWLAGRARVAILDRDLCPGLGGILWSEIRSCAPRDTLVQGYVLGLGGGDIRPGHIEKVLADLLARETSERPVLLEVG